jgi:hypothetical protein
MYVNVRRQDRNRYRHQHHHPPQPRMMHGRCPSLAGLPELVSSHRLEKRECAGLGHVSIGVCLPRERRPAGLHREASVTAAPGPAGVRVWEVMSRGWGPRTGRPAAGGHGPQGNPVQFPDPTPFPHRFPVNSHALPSVEGLVGQDEIDAAIHTMSTSNARRVDFGGCGPPI